MPAFYDFNFPPSFDSHVDAEEYTFYKKKALRIVDKARKQWGIRSNTFSRHQVAELMARFLLARSDPDTYKEESHQTGGGIDCLPDCPACKQKI